ncbi:MAG: cytochrome d ubiquinol oxidase subunit II [Gammaproteobacteria bacterium]|nr:MAG: cytochrome d ubiquinol oxidase subunit II [Gammaproteobacteria bacterium]UTW41974.1 cytochrome d ubiquinol oxidase subunit II [bacterium SCSIO 12844]
MISYEFLQVFWWLVLGIMFCIYASTAGYDLAVTMIFPWLKSEEDRRIVLNTSAPVWDGNNTWIIFIGGLMFVVFPPLYAISFSGLLAAIYCILWSFFLRPVGYDYRGKIDSHKWRRMWDYLLFISAFIPVLVFGVAASNAFIGFGYQTDPIFLRTDFNETFWELLSVCGILGGLSSLLMLLAHGGIYIARRTEDHLRALGKKIHFVCTILFIIAFILMALFIVFIYGFDYKVVANSYDIVAIYKPHGWWTNLIAHPWKFLGPIGIVIFIILSLILNYKNKFALAFWANTGVIFSTIGSTGLILYPYIFPSYEKPQQSLTLWNATPSHYTLQSLFYIAIVCFVIVTIYRLFGYYTLWHKEKTITKKIYEENKNHFY